MSGRAGGSVRQRPQDQAGARLRHEQRRLARHPRPGARHGGDVGRRRRPQQQRDAGALGRRSRTASSTLWAMSTDSGSSRAVPQPGRAGRGGRARRRARARPAGPRAAPRARRPPDGSVSRTSRCAVRDQEAGPAGVGEPAGGRRDDRPGRRPSTGSSVTRKPWPAAGQRRVEGEVGDDAVDGVHPQAARAHRGDQREHRVAARRAPARERALARAAAKRWCPSAMTAPVPAEGRGEPLEHGRVGHPPQPVAARRRGRRAPASARRGAAVPVSSATAGSGSWASTIGSRSVRGRGQQRAAALDRGRDRCPRAAAPPPTRRGQRDGAQPADRGRRAAGRLQLVEPQGRLVVAVEDARRPASARSVRGGLRRGRTVARPASPGTGVDARAG